MKSMSLYSTGSTDNALYKQCLISIGVDLPLEDFVDVQLRGVCHCLVGNTSIGVDLLDSVLRFSPFSPLWLLIFKIIPVNGYLVLK